MEKLFGGLIVQFQEFYKSIGPTKRVALTVSGLLIVMALGMVTFMASGKDYVVLMKDMPADQMSLVSSKLNAKNMAKGILFVGNATIINDEIIALKQRLI